MRRALTLGVAWIAAAVTATAIAWQGVRVVGDQVTDDRPASLTVAEVEAAVADGTGTTGTTVPDGSTSVPPTTAAPDPAAVTRTYALSGGSVALHFDPAGVSVVFATPAPGYQVRSEPTGEGGWRVEFEGAAGRSRVEGWWDGGPHDRVDDDGAASDDDGPDDDG